MHKQEKITKNQNIMELPIYTTFEEKSNFFETDYNKVGVNWIINTPEEADAMLAYIEARQQEIEQRRSAIKERFRSSEFFKNDTEEQHQRRFVDIGLEDGLLFRGVSEAKYMIFSSAQRCWLKNELNERGLAYVDFVDGLIKQIRENKLLKDYYSALGVQHNDLLYMSLLQHYGECSPLIDVSYGVDAALYFALDRRKNDEPVNDIDNYCSLYMFDTFANQYWGYLDSILQNGQENATKMLEDAPYPIDIIDTSNTDSADLYTRWINPRNNGRGLHNWELALVKLPTANGAITPITRIGQKIRWTNLNLLAQRGGFFLYTKNQIPLEDYICRHNELPKIICYNINKDLKDCVMQKINLTEADIYPKMKDIVNNEIDTFKRNIDVELANT